MSRDLAPWATSARSPKRGLAGALDGFGADVVSMVRGWKRRAAAVPAGLSDEQRTKPVPGARDVDLRPARTPAAAKLRRNVRVQVRGLDDVADLRPPLLVVANHPGELDETLLLASLPQGWRLMPAGQVGTVLASRRSVLAFPEGEPEPDGHLGSFDATAIAAAVQQGVPVVPVAVRGTFALGELSWRGANLRPEVIVRVGLPLPTHGSDPASLAAQARAAVAALLAETDATWWQTRRSTPEPDGEPASAWRRAWAASKPRVDGRARIWS